LSVLPVSGGILQASKTLRVGVAQSAQQVGGQRDAGNFGEVVAEQIAITGHAGFDHLVEPGEQAFFFGAPEVEGREGDDGVKAERSSSTTQARLRWRQTEPGHPVPTCRRAVPVSSPYTHATPGKEVRDLPDCESGKPRSEPGGRDKHQADLRAGPESRA